MICIEESLSEILLQDQYRGKKIFSKTLRKEIQIKEFLFYKWIKELMDSLLILNNLNIPHLAFHSKNIFLSISDQNVSVQNEFEHLSLTLSEFSIAQHVHLIPDDQWNKRVEEFEGLVSMEYLRRNESLNSSNCGINSDIYSFGVLLYYMANAKKPRLKRQESVQKIDKKEKYIEINIDNIASLKKILPGDNDEAENHNIVTGGPVPLDVNSEIDVADDISRDETEKAQKEEVDEVFENNNEELVIRKCANFPNELTEFIRKCVKVDQEERIQLFEANSIYITFTN